MDIQKKENQLMELLLSDITPDPNQPRKDFEDIALVDLANSIKAVGVIQAITVRRIDDNRYMIIAGERRWRASKIAEKETIPAIIVNNEDQLTSDAIYTQQLTENLHRENLNPVEKAEFIQSRIIALKQAGVNNAIEKVAEELGVSNSWVSKNTAILKYSEEVRKLAQVGKIRDYSAIKKVDALTGDKRREAIRAIEDGSFNAKEFFSRKRRTDIVPNDDSESNAPDQKSTDDPKQTSMMLKFTPDQCVRLMTHAGYSAILDENDPEWVGSDNETLKGYFKTFLSWVDETSQAA